MTLRHTLSTLPTPSPPRKRDFDLVLPVQLVVVQRILRHHRTPLINVLHKRNVPLRADDTHFVKVGVLREQGVQLIFRNALWQILQEQNLVRRQILIRHLHCRSLRLRQRSSTVHWQKLMSVVWVKAGHDNREHTLSRQSLEPELGFNRIGIASSFYKLQSCY